MTFFIISVLVVNLILWGIFLIRFKRLFSTDDIINKTEQKVNHFIKEIDQAADRDTYLAKETTKRIKSMLDDADRKMELFQQATTRLRDMIAEADKINKGQKYTIIESTKPEQGNLFEEPDNTYTDKKPAKSIPKKETGEIPLVITKVYDEKSHKMTEEEKKKHMPDLVRKMFADGRTPEEIAQNLNCSITEIQFIIDLL